MPIQVFSHCDLKSEPRLVIAGKWDYGNNYNGGGDLSGKYYAPGMLQLPITQVTDVGQQSLQIRS